VKIQKIIPYVGYGKPNEVYLMGSVILEREKIKSHALDSRWSNSKRMIQNFSSRPIKNCSISVTVNEKKLVAQTDDRGYFETKFQFEDDLEEGWHTAYYEVVDGPDMEGKTGKFLIVGKESSMGIISDIDDTIVKSYAYTFFKKLWVLLTKNETTRKLTQNIHTFYNKLHAEENPFFYVSSSERNLYTFWVTLLQERGFPDGPLLLNRSKFGIKQLLFSGKGHHEGKYQSIVHLLSLYRQMKFVLIGDNGQRDIHIYASIVEQFPDQIASVYIVKVKERHLSSTVRHTFKKSGVDVVITKDIDEALSHARLKEII
tara:strand:- start:5826 stop:6770 length:945 start_codon:yes stop_codon:yes gene_type:complete